MQSLRLRIVFFFLHFEKQIILPGLKYENCSCARREELPGGGWEGVSSQAEHDPAQLCPKQQEIQWFKQENFFQTLTKNKGVSAIV